MLRWPEQCQSVCARLLEFRLAVELVVQLHCDLVTFQRGFDLMIDNNLRAGTEGLLRRMANNRDQLTNKVSNTSWHTQGEKLVPTTTTTNSNSNALVVPGADPKLSDLQARRKFNTQKQV